MSPSLELENNDAESPVLVVGGGPSGLLMAHMLAKFGVKTLVIERYPTRLAAPKAHALSPRTLEFSRQVGLDVNKIRQVGTCRSDAYWVNFVTNLSDEQRVGKLPYERMDVDVLNATPTMIHNIPQPEFEQIISDELRNTDLVEIRKNHSFVGLEDHGDNVTTTIEDRNNGSKYQVRSKHVVACDGAKSAVKQFLQVESEGEDSYETMMTIHINADLRPVVKENVGMLHWVMDPRVSGFIIAYSLDGNQVMICNFDSEKHPLTSWNEDLCRQVVNAAIGQSVPYKVLSYRPWVLNRKVAKSYRVGNVFLAGDAAHAFPPTGGLGLNSGLGDVHNLAYKLAAVHQGWGGTELLNSYQADRQQVALVNSQQSIKNGKQIFGLLRALGATDPDKEVAWYNLKQRLYTNDSDTKKLIEEGIEAQREHFDNLGLHIGYIYGDREIPANASVYHPVAVPGARLPHAWIKVRDAYPSSLLPPPIDNSFVQELSQEEIYAKRFSTLDLIPFNAFTIITDREGGQEWTSQLVEACRQLPESLKLQVVVRGVHFDIDESDENGRRWLDLMGFAEGKATLVRPDQHVLTILDKESRREDLIRVLREHLDI